MTSYYKTIDGKIQEIEQAQDGCWVSMTAPGMSEIRTIGELYEIDLDDLRAALDLDERSRIEVEDTYTMILVNIPTIEADNEKELFNTIPLSILSTVIKITLAYEFLVASDVLKTISILK